MNYHFEIIPKDWYKRCSPSKNLPIAISAEIDDFELKANHMCYMKVSYNNGTYKTLLARVIQNHITKEWKVDGMEVAVKVIIN